MKNDFMLLAIAALVAALALTNAAAHDALPARTSWRNPLASWPASRCALVLGILIAASALSYLTLLQSGANMQPSPSDLEWAPTQAAADDLLRQYDDAGTRGRAIRGTILDSVLFIPSYTLMIAVACFFAPRGVTHPAWQSLLVLLGWLALAAGGCDYLENAGIFLALGGVTTALAPLTYAFCQVKWLLALTALDTAAIAGLARLVGGG